MAIGLMEEQEEEEWEEEEEDWEEEEEEEEEEEQEGKQEQDAHDAVTAGPSRHWAKRTPGNTGPPHGR